MMKIPKITTDQNYCGFGVVIPRLSPLLGIPLNMDILNGSHKIECKNSSKNLACLHDNPERNRFAVTYVSWKTNLTKFPEEKKLSFLREKGKE